MAMQKISRPSVFSMSGPSMAAMMPQTETCGLCIQTAALAQDMLNAVTSLHRIHLKVTGLGSYAAHKALNQGYDEFGDHADDLVEEYQGAEEKLLDLPNTAPAELNSVEEALDFLRKMKDKITALQSVMPHSEIVNLLDNAKSTINSVKYKLLFLK
jgi:DNA-binding ferritin-like protein